MFLRYFQESGIVLRAAEQAGIARSTLYRWRDEDPRFRARWDSLAEQRRQQLEDTLMEISTDGERVPVFYKGVQVGWQQKNRLRATIALLAHLDRREKRQLAAGAKAELRESVSRSGVSRSGVSRSGVSRSGVSR
ncbi:MAG: hypothetical protein PS018_14755, partial [bacterium]|nr:hypothetical protein [bacterium]